MEIKDTKGLSSLPSKTLLRVAEVASFFGVSNKTIYNWVETGKLLATNPSGGSLRIFRDSVMDFIKDGITLRR